VNIFLRIILLPFTLIYSIVVRLRNFFYDIGLLKSTSYDFPTIVVGNLSVGGTGKTPHTDFILSILKKDYLSAVLSRGYGRKTKGYKLADSGDRPSTIGDEPFQIFSKHPEILVAVDEKRKRGIEKLRALPSAPQLIVLDDAFQHRRVKAGLNILLTDYSKLFINDIVLPSGRLREPKTAAKRADIIVVTKSPKVLSPLEIRRITNELKPKAYQKVFFSFIDYQNLRPLNVAAKEIGESISNMKNFGVLALSAIANPKPFELHLNRYAKEINYVRFRDHHFFNEKDYQKIKEKVSELFSPQKAIVTTEKDAVKLDVNKFGEIPVFSLPIEIKFHKHEEEDFTKEIKDYVRSYTRER